MKRWLPAIALVVVVAGALIVGSRGGGSSPATREAQVESEVRCPQCEGQSVQASDAPAARAVRDYVHTQIAAGKSNGEIEQALVDRYGSDLLLRPSSSGITGLVWILPVAALAIAAAGLVLAFRRWNPRRWLT